MITLIAYHYQVEGFLEEMLLLAARAEEYNQFLLAKMADAVAPAPLSAARHNTFRCCSTVERKSSREQH